MGGWSRVPPLSPLTITEIGFSGPFFTPRARKNHRAEGNRGHDAQINNSGAASEGARPLPDGMDLPCTSGRPAMYLAPRSRRPGPELTRLPARPQGCRWRGPARPETGAGDAGYIAGPRQVYGRSMPGTRQAGARDTAGPREVHGAWPDGAPFPSASLTWSPAWITTPPRPAPRRRPARADTR